MALSDSAAYIAKLSAPPPGGAPCSVTVPGSERPNRTAVYRNFRFRDTPLLETLDPAVRTQHDAFESAAAYRGSRDCLGWRPWNAATQTWEPRFEWLSYAAVAERRRHFGAGIVELHRQAGVTADKFGVGLWSQNRPEWQIAELGFMSQSLWNVSLYETLGPDASEYIINHGQLACVVASLAHMGTLLRLAPRLPSVKLLVCMDALDAGEPAGDSKGALLRTLAAAHGIAVYSMAEVEALGARSGRVMRPPRKEDITTINYTSGTTGDPKGVVLTHGNMVASVSTSRAAGLLVANGVYLSYLPLAHIYGRMADWSALSVGARLGYFHGDIAGLVEDMQLLRPSGMVSVPRVFNRMHSAIRAATVEATGAKGALSRAAMAAKTARMRLPAGQATNWHPLYDRIWSPKVRRAVGLERATFLVSGSAQLDPEVQHFLQAAFGIRFVQGYGMTETSAVGAMQQADDFSGDTIGGPQPGVEFCIESVPDLEYTVDDKPHARGELLMRGPIVFREYYRNAEETGRAFDADGSGWFHSGDIVEVDARGCFRIIDRKKNVLKLAQGEYVSPERIENVYIGAVPAVAAAFVHGDGKEASLVAVLGVEPEAFARVATEAGVPVAAGDAAALQRATADPRVKAAVLQQMDAAARTHRFNNFERVRNIVLAVEPFTVENGLLTPTLKLKRVQTAKAFRSQIDAMYAELKTQVKAKI